MKFGKTMKAVALGLAFTAAAGLVTVRKAVADLFKFNYTAASSFTLVQDPSLGNKITSAYIVLDIDPGYEGWANSFVDWGISTKEELPGGGTIGYEIKKGDPGAYLWQGAAQNFMHIVQDGSNGFKVVDYWFHTSNGHMQIVTRNYIMPADIIYDLDKNKINYVLYKPGTWSYEPVSAVPLPSSVLLLSTGLGGLALARRIRKTAPKNNLG